MTVDDRLINETTSLCSVCLNAVPARVVANAEGEVWLRKSCPTHGEQQARLSTDAAWYEHILWTRRYQDDCVTYLGAFHDRAPIIA